MSQNAVQKESPDYFLFGTVAILVLLGIMILASVSAAPSQQKYGSPIVILFRHIILGILPGIGLSYIVYRTSLLKIKKSLSII